MAADRDELSQGTVLKGNLEGQINVLKEQIHTEEMNQEHLEHRRDVIKEELAAKNQQLASYREERKAMGDQVRDAVKAPGGSRSPSWGPGRVHPPAGGSH